MAESEENKPKPNFVVPMNFEISDRPLEQIEKSDQSRISNCQRCLWQN